MKTKEENKMMSIREKIAAKAPFKKGNISAYTRHYGKYIFYVVWSYGWYPIFVYSSYNNVWYENSDGWSKTTKKQITRYRPDVETTLISLKDRITPILDIIKATEEYLFVI